MKFVSIKPASPKKGENTKMTQNPKAQRKEVTLRQEHKSDANFTYDTAKEPCYLTNNKKEEERQDGAKKHSSNR